MSVVQQAKIFPLGGSEDPIGRLLARIEDRSARIGIIGLGYVGLPLALAFANDFTVVGFDTNRRRVETLNAGGSHILDVSPERVADRLDAGTFSSSDDYAILETCDALIICVPTPLEQNKDPDLSYVQSATQAVAATLRPGQLVILESTTYPGTTDELLLPLLERHGLKLDVDFLLAFSPERVDPGNKRFELTHIPKVVGGCSQLSTQGACMLYASIMQQVHPVSSARAAETAKLLENTFRSVNIGLVNEIALLCHQLGIDASEVIDAAATKPFGFMPFYPGPGVGGHCIPLDPLYLSWRAKQQGFVSRFIALADDVNSAMPEHIVDLTSEALNEHGKALKGSHVLLLGVSYKADVDDVRHTPAIPIIDRLRAKGAHVDYHDPYVAHFDLDLHEWPEWRPRLQPHASDRRRRLSDTALTHLRRRRDDALESIPLTPEHLERADCVIIVTQHHDVNYDRVAQHSKIIIDTRNALTPQQRQSASGMVVRL